MDKRKLAKILEIIPLVSLVAGLILVFLPIKGQVYIWGCSVLFFLAFFGFAFGIIARLLIKGDKTVKILSIFDFISSVIVLLFYYLVSVALGQ
ncbi:MAG: hypothetical protein IKS48_10855 [Eubacterium sp.]|nr:hypothetical protein [Eubacterium sp.]